MVQPSDLQVERSIAALLRGAQELGTRHPAAVDIPAAVSRRLASVPPVRPDRVAAARARLAGGDAPTADEVAGKLVGRLVCDRLR